MSAVEITSELQQKVKRWVRETLKDQNFVKMEIEFPDFDTTGGFAGEIVFVTVTGEEKDGNKKTLNLLVKKGKDDCIVQDNLNFKHVYENEVNFYSKFVPYFRKFAKEKKVQPFDNLPYCYGTIVEGNQYVIILENLKLQGFKTNFLKRPFDLNHIKLTLEAYAKWHAFNLALKDQQPEIFQQFAETNKSGLLDTKIINYLIRHFLKHVDILMEQYKEKNNADVFKKLEILKENFEEKYKDTLSPKNKDHLVILHGDCWNNNYLFHYDETESTPDKMVVIDWQLATIGSPVADITHCIFNCFSTEDFNIIDDLLKFYYDILSKKLKQLGSDPDKCFPWEMLVNCFNKFVPVGIVLTVSFTKARYVSNQAIKFDLAEVEKKGGMEFASADIEIENAAGYFEEMDRFLKLCIESKFL